MVLLWFLYIPLFHCTKHAPWHDNSPITTRCRKAEAVPILRGVVLGMGILISAAAQMSADQTSAMRKTGAK